jgi:hypothetical protein
LRRRTVPAIPFSRRGQFALSGRLDQQTGDGTLKASRCVSRGVGFITILTLEPVLTTAIEKTPGGKKTN